MNKFYLVVTPVVFLAGVFLGQFCGSESSSASSKVDLDAREKRDMQAKLNAELITQKASGFKLQALVDELSGDSAGFHRLDVNLDNPTAQRILNNMPEDQLTGYLDQSMHSSDLNYIDNPRQFASRAIEAYFDTGLLSADARLYAHLNTNGPVPVNGRIFVKWVNASSGEVVLFEKKDVADNTTKSWVSVVPNGG